jgi:hypothetical protein
MKGSIRTHNREKMEARRIDHTMMIVGVRFCLPIKPLRKGYKCTITQNAKKSFPNRGPQDWYPLLTASEIPATTPTMLIIRRVVGGMSRVVNLNKYSSAKPPSSACFDVTVKFVSIPAKTFSRPWNRAKRWDDTPPITQNCSFLHHSSIPTPDHLISRIPVAKMERKREINHKLAKLLIVGMINCPVSRQMAGRVQ